MRFGRGPAIHSPAGPWRTPPAYVSPFLDEHGQPRGQAWDMDDGYLRFLTNEQAEFIVDRNGTEIWVDAPRSSPQEISEYLVGPIFALMLRRRGHVCLHASVVCLHNRAVALLGAEGSGKSTLAAVFALQGRTVLADDLAVLIESDTTWHVPPGPRYVRSRRGVVEQVALDSGHAGILTACHDHEFLDLAVPAAEPAHDCRSRRDETRGFAELGAIYVLDRTQPQGTTTIDSLHGTTAVMTLLALSWATRPLAREFRGQELDVLARTVETVAVRHVRVAADDRDVRGLAKAIERDFTMHVASEDAARGGPPWPRSQ